ncbi:MAG: hypothetical protein IH801_07290 [Nitrospinae bacterium]|nr:hypothetical protein [Nitrospinota bacterium]
MLDASFLKNLRTIEARYPDRRSAILPALYLLQERDGYITPEGIEYHGGESITRALRLLPGGWVFGLFDLWGVTFIRELAYTLVASNRPVVSKLTRLFGLSRSA